MISRLLKMLFAVLGALPLGVRGFLGRSIGSLCYLIPHREREVARLQLDLFLAAQGGSSKNLHAMYRHLGQTVLEFLNLDPILKRSAELIMCDADELIARNLKIDRPIVALTAHTGNWDLLAAYIVQRGAQLSAVGREMRKPGLHEVLAGLRERYGVTTLWRNPQRGPKDIVELLKQKKVIAALIDQDTDVTSVFVPFMGAPAKTPSSLIALGQRYNALFITGFLGRHADGRFEAILEEVPDGLSIQEVLTVYNARLEGHIRRFPEQWVWLHKRWRSLPSGRLMRTREYMQHLSAQLERVHIGGSIDWTHSTQL